MSTPSDAGPCFFCADVPAAGEKASLGDEETRHASASRRIGVGDMIGLIDGAGTRASAVVETVSRRALAFTVQERVRVPPPDPAIVVASAVPKGERFRAMIDMLAQLGVAGIAPLVCERSAVRPRRSARDRWRRIAVEACKQSRNPHVPEIHEPAGVHDSLARLPAAAAVLFADVDGAGIAEVLPARGRVYLYVGPEGGFSEGEKSRLRAHGARRLSLGANVLRIETAAVAGAALALLGVAPAAMKP